jgi:hypothetical protein
MDFLFGRVKADIDRKLARTTEGGRGETAFSNDIPEATGKYMEHSPGYFSPTSTVSSLNSDERVTQGDPDSPGPAESPVPSPLQEECQVTYSNAGMDIKYAYGNLAESPTKTQGEADTFSDDIPEATEGYAEHSPAYFAPASIVSSPHSQEMATRDDFNPPSPGEFPVPAPPQEVYQATCSNAGTGVRYAFENLAESQAEINTPPAVTASTPLSLQCRMCNAPPTITMRPTVTMCGHIFCSEYVLRIFRGAGARLTLHQVHNTTCDVNPQLSCVRQRSPVVLFIQTRSPSIILTIRLL